VHDPPHVTRSRQACVRARKLSAQVLR
jgi:hypothetical protein